MFPGVREGLHRAVLAVRGGVVQGGYCLGYEWRGYTRWGTVCGGLYRVGGCLWGLYREDIVLGVSGRVVQGRRLSVEVVQGGCCLWGLYKVGAVLGVRGGVVQGGILSVGVVQDWRLSLVDCTGQVLSWV